MLVLVFERDIYCVPYEVLRCLFLSVFLCITVTHGSDGNPLAFGMARIIDTTVGIVIALVIYKSIFVL